MSTESATLRTGGRSFCALTILFLKFSKNAWNYVLFHAIIITVSVEDKHRITHGKQHSGLQVAFNSDL